METQMLVGIVVALVALAAVAWLYATNQRRKQLKQRFGPEYDRTVEAVGTPAKADAVLHERAARVRRFNLRKLDPGQADTFAREWRRVQGLIEKGIAEGAKVVVGGAGRPEGVTKGF